MHRLVEISNALTRLCDWAARIAAVFLVTLVFVIMYDVVGRKFFSTGSVLLQDLEWHLHGVIAMFPIGYAYTRNAHVRIDVLANKIPKRTRLWLEFFAVTVFVIPFFLLIAWYGYEFAERAFLRGEGNNSGLGLPHRWVIKSVIPISALITVCGCAAVATRILVVLRRPDILSTAFIERPLWTR